MKKFSITICLYYLLFIVIIISYFVVLNKGADILDEQTEKFKLVRSEALQNIEDIDYKNFNTRSEGAIYDKEGNLITKLKEQNYQYLSYEDIPEHVINAVISIEDERFYEHNGIDLKGITRAFALLVLNKGEITQGGSTITQQLAKNMFLTQEKTFDRKFEEMFISIELEKQFTKAQILEFYLNNIYFGRGGYGVETASQYYFSKPSNELTLPETAFLLAIPNNPSIYDPVINPENTEKRKNLILLKMHEHGHISDEEYEKYKNTKVELNITGNKNAYKETYVTSYVIADATEKLMALNGFEFKYDFKSNEEREAYKKKYNEAFHHWNKEIRRGGYHIYTSIDMEKQNVVQEAINRHLSGFKRKNKETGIYETQGAGVVVENNTGYVVAISGGRTQEGIQEWFNRAYSSYRQPGSTAKPIVSYTPAFEKGLLPFDTMTDEEKEGFPNNVDKRHRGDVTIRYAVEISINTIPFQIALNYGSNHLLDYLREMEFSKIVDEDDHAGVAIGGFTYGVTPLEMAGAYSTLARYGLYVKPTSIVRIEDTFGKVIYEDDRKPKRIYKKESSFLMTDVLKGVAEKPHGTGYRYRLNNMTSAVKTGTTNENKDGWFIGYTPYYTGVAWVGNDIPESSTLRSVSKYSGSIWNDFMTKIHEGLEDKDFEVPSNFERIYVNKHGRYSLEEKTGYLPEWIQKDVYEAFKESEEEKRKAREEYEKYQEKLRKEQEKIERLKEEAMKSENKKQTEDEMIQNNLEEQEQSSSVEESVDEPVIEKPSNVVVEENEIINTSEDE